MITCKYLVKNEEGFKNLVDFVHEHYKLSSEDKFSVDEDFPETYPCVYVIEYSIDGDFVGYDTVELIEFTEARETVYDGNMVCI